VSGPSITRSWWAQMCTRAIVALAIVLPLATPAGVTEAQTRVEPVLRVFSGDVALVRRDGSAVQPVPTGTVVRPGDQLRAVSAGGARIRLFDGYDTHMEQGTILVFGGLVTEGSRVNLMMAQVQGRSQTTVGFFHDPGSSLNMVLGGARIVVTQGVLAVAGPEDSSSGTAGAFSCFACRSTDFAEGIGSGRGIARSPRDLSDFSSYIALAPGVSSDGLAWETVPAPAWDWEQGDPNLPLIAASHAVQIGRLGPPPPGPPPPHRQARPRRRARHLRRSPSRTRRSPG
jgi:hypothetical protein